MALNGPLNARSADMMVTNQIEGEHGGVDAEFRSFNRLPKAVREAINAAPVKISSVSIASRKEPQAAMLARIERTIVAWRDGII